jgi:ABC-type glycerol-3-phosphate transport system substrate-binding protein
MGKRVTMLVMVIAFLLIPALLVYSFKGKENQKESVSNPLLKPVNAKTEIKWIGQWIGEGDKEKFIREMANEYEFLNQESTVNLKFKDDVYKEADETNFIVEQCKKPVADWDILVRVHIHYNAIAEIFHDPNWGEKYLVDFGKIPGYIESQKSFINTPMYKDRHFGPYNEGQLATLFVNTEVAKKMGIQVKQFGMTFEDFAGYLKAANEYNKSHSYITPIFGDNWNKLELIFTYLFYSQMNSYDQIADTKYSPEKLAAIEKCFNACEELSQYKPISKQRANMQWEKTNQYPLIDSCLFYPNFTFMYDIWKLKGKDKLNKIIPCEFPVFKPATVCIGGYVANWAVLNNAPHKEAAIKMLMYWCRPEVAEKWVRYTKCPSGVKGNLAESALGVDPFENYVYTVEKRYNGRMISDMDKQFMLGEKNSSIEINSTAVLEGKKSAKTAFAELKANLKRL